MTHHPAGQCGRRERFRRLWSPCHVQEGTVDEWQLENDRRDAQAPAAPLSPSPTETWFIQKGHAWGLGLARPPLEHSHWMVLRGARPAAGSATKSAKPPGA